MERKAKKTRTAVVSRHTSSLYAATTSCRRVPCDSITSEREWRLGCQRRVAEHAPCSSDSWRCSVSAKYGRSGYRMTLYQMNSLALSKPYIRGSTCAIIRMYSCGFTTFLPFTATCLRRRGLDRQRERLASFARYFERLTRLDYKFCSAPS